MKRAIGLIAATLLTTSVYSQDYSSSSQNPDSTPPNYESRQSEAGAPATSDSSRNSSSGYELNPGASGGNNSTGQSGGANIGSAADQDQTLTTRDSEVSGSEYRGTVEDESLRGSGTADGAFHEPAAPVREGSQSEGWSTSGTFSGAGPGSVSGSASSTLTPPVSESSSSSFDAEVSSNAALDSRNQDLSDRGLEPDSNALSRDEVFERLDRDINDDGIVIFEDWTIVEPDTSVGGPAGSDSGSASNSEMTSDSYSHDLHLRVQRDWSSRLGNTDVPATLGIQPMTPGVLDHHFDHLRVYNPDRASDVGAPSGSESGAKSSDDAECDTHKGSSAEFEQGEANSESTGAPGEYGDRATSGSYDDGHLSGNNAAGSSGASENSTSSSEDGALTQPDL